MTAINKILTKTGHRPYAMPGGKWRYYQEWNRAVFLHWKVPEVVLRSLVPEGLTIDTYGGNAYVSLVAFTMEQIRPRYLPAVGFISCFDEINLRTYIEIDGKKGVYFLNIEAGKSLSSVVARGLSGLPYEKSDMIRTPGGYRSDNGMKNFFLDLSYTVGGDIDEKSELDRWLTERYCLYLDKGSQLYRYDIHHEEWKLKTVVLDRTSLDYRLGALQLTGGPDMTHYSDGVKVVAWKRTVV